MKISKLFHWLYAFLMFLPVTFLLPSLLYFAFNDNAQAQEVTIHQPTYYETNDVVTEDDLIPGNLYTYTASEVRPSSGEIFVDCLYLEVDFGFVQNTYTIQRAVPYFKLYSNRLILAYVDDAHIYDNGYSTNGTLTFVYQNSTASLSEVISNISRCDKLIVKEYTDYTYSMSITESINQSILEIFDLPMFSWTSDNFIIAPFNYITNLFGLPNGNVVNKYLDYWLSISIIYLCFDVIMYVPLLVHRWLDKGIVE